MVKAPVGRGAEAEQLHVTIIRCCNLEVPCDQHVPDPVGQNRARHFPDRAMIGDMPQARTAIPATTDEPVTVFGPRNRRDGTLVRQVGQLRTASCRPDPQSAIETAAGNELAPAMEPQAKHVTAVAAMLQLSTGGWIPDTDRAVQAR